MNRGSALLLAGAALAGIAATAFAQSGPAAGVATLPISQLDLMRATVETSSAGIFALQYEEKIADPDWLLIQQDAVNLAGASALMLVPGTGPKDAEWVAAADWKGWTGAMREASLQIRKAAAAKDLATLGTAGDALAETCTACHAKYRGETATDGVSRYPFYPKRQRAPSEG